MQELVFTHDEATRNEERKCCKQSETDQRDRAMGLRSDYALRPNLQVRL